MCLLLFGLVGAYERFGGLIFGVGWAPCLRRGDDGRCRGDGLGLLYPRSEDRGAPVQRVLPFSLWVLDAERPVGIPTQSIGTRSM